MNQRRDRQRGMTAIGWLVVLGLIGFFALLTLRLAPIYLEHFNVRTSLESLESEPYITRKSSGEVRKLLTKRLRVNDVKNVANEHIKIQKQGGRLTVDIRYEVRKHILGNIDAVVMFSDSTELISN